jgi:hypothetical protein
VDFDFKTQIEEWKKEHYAKSFFTIKTAKRAGAVS